MLPHPLVDLTAEPEAHAGTPPIQLLEGVEYGYEWELSGEGPPVECEPAEIFFCDDQLGIRGRLRPGLNTGSLDVRVYRQGKELGGLELEVRSRKLDYLSEYRWMLRDIAAQLTEVLMQRFGASALAFVPDPTRDSITLYQRLAFLKAMLADEGFQRALAEISRRPYVSWDERTERVRAGSALRASSAVAAQLARSGPRTSWTNGRLKTLPTEFASTRTEATLDNVPNRFVRFALERWRSIVSEIQDALDRGSQTSTSARGQRESALLLQQLAELLTGPVLREVGVLSAFPGDNQVLHKRPGYREVFRSYLDFELAAQLSWNARDTRFHAGQRDVAELYEYWCFLTLSKIVGETIGQPIDLRPMLRVSKDRLDIALGKGREVALSAEISRGDRRLRLELWFNRTFEAGAREGSWSVRMRPDMSLVISACDYSAADFVPIVIHFDAKYRLDGLEKLFGRSEDVSVNEVQPLREDLLKMHAYRDAVRRSAGAYVLYPGVDSSPPAGKFQEYDELLPGLGAFALRPTVDGTALGSRALQVFLDEVLLHISERLSRHERARYWVEDTYASAFAPGSRRIVYPAETATVLLGFVKSQGHWEWIKHRKAYNVRAAGRSGGVPAESPAPYSTFLVLYGPTIPGPILARIVSAPERMTHSEMKSVGYPSPQGDYFCVQLSWDVPQDWIHGVGLDHIEGLVSVRGRLHGEPTQVVWGDLRSPSWRAS
jgi:predicted component of viral defense system (DUF524 family)